MSSYKNFTEAMNTKGHSLNMHEQRHGYAKREDGSLLGFAAKKMGTEGKTVTEQYFDNGKNTFISILKTKKPSSVWKPSIDTKQPVYIYTGGEFIDSQSKIKRVKNPKGSGYFQQQMTVNKTVAGVKEEGAYILVSAESCTVNTGCFKLVFGRV